MQKKENKIKIYCNLMDGVVEQWLSEKVPYVANSTLEDNLRPAMPQILRALRRGQINI